MVTLITCNCYKKVQLRRLVQRYTCCAFRHTIRGNINTCHNITSSQGGAALWPLFALGSGTLLKLNSLLVLIITSHIGYHGSSTIYHVRPIRRWPCPFIVGHSQHRQYKVLQTKGSPLGHLDSVLLRSQNWSVPLQNVRLYPVLTSFCPALLIRRNFPQEKGLLIYVGIWRIALNWSDVPRVGDPGSLIKAVRRQRLSTPTTIKVLVKIRCPSCSGESSTCCLCYSPNQCSSWWYSTLDSHGEGTNRHDMHCFLLSPMSREVQGYNLGRVSDVLRSIGRTFQGLGTLDPWLKPSGDSDYRLQQQSRCW